MSDNQELNEMLSKAGNSSPSLARSGRPPRSSRDEYGDDEEELEDQITKSYSQWTTHNSRIFVPASKTKAALPPGVYEIDSSPNIGLYFEKIPVKTEGLLRFPDTNSNKVVEEIQRFWTLEASFKQYGLAYKRGILLWGPPGSGKSCTLQLIMADVIKRGGIVVKFDDPYLFIDGIRVLRQVQPHTPVVVMLEDIDSILKMYNESEVLNILDGVNETERMVFLATTNYPEELGHRIINRPSRFDKRFKIGFPSAASRKMYFEHLVGGKKKVKELGIDLKQWVTDTEKFSIAHMKELFIAVHILGDDYKEAIETLKSMREDVDTREPDEGMNTIFTRSRTNKEEDQLHYEDDGDEG